MIAYHRWETQQAEMVGVLKQAIQKLTPFDTNWRKGSGATPLTTQDL
jgi:hypothetical protein